MRQITDPANRGEQSSRRPLRLRTVLLLRWLAVIGQIAAITVADRFLELSFPVLLCYIAVGVVFTSNFLLTFLMPHSKRLSERQVFWLLELDLWQLAFLIYLCGGMSNPFVLLVIIPVTISASTMSLRSTIFLGLSAIAVASIVFAVNIPIVLPDGEALLLPLLFKTGYWFALVLGIIFLAFYSRRISLETEAMANALLATQMALAREQKLTDLGGVVAAAAHELGTPLATIKLVTGELLSELKGQPDLYEDVELIRTQTDRCRDILRDMGRAGKDDLQLHQTSLSELLREAAEPHLDRGREVIFDLRPAYRGAGREPMVLRRPEIIHGLRNLVQNAVDFSHARVWVDARWSSPSAEGGHITIRISDDGDGFSQNVLQRIGDPFLRNKKPEQGQNKRPEYEGMGLGLFIAKTLLERTGAKLSFSNGLDPFLMVEDQVARSGAVVEATWPSPDLLAPPDMTAALNEQIRS